MIVKPYNTIDKMSMGLIRLVINSTHNTKSLGIRALVAASGFTKQTAMLHQMTDERLCKHDSLITILLMKYRQLATDL